MPRMTVRSGPAFVVWPVTRGDDESLPLYFANPGGYTITQLGDGAEDVTLTNPLDMSGSTYTFSVATARGATPLFAGAVDTTNAATGELTLSMTDTQTALLTASTYVWDLVQVSGGGATETALIIGTMKVAGRVTA